MIFTLLCHMILLDSWTVGLPQGPSPTFMSSQSASNSLPSSQLPNPRYSRVQRQTTRRDWLYPTFTPLFAPRTSSTGLAYRSIFPSSQSEYLNIYRNRDIWSDSSSNGGRVYGEKSSPSSSKPESTILAKGSSKNDLKKTEEVEQQQQQQIKLRSTTTTEPRSAPATDAFSSGRSSSTVEMNYESDELLDGIQDRGEKPGPDGTKIVIHRRKSKVRQDESMIVFPSDSHHGPTNKTASSTPKLDDAVSSYVPPSFKLNKATVESLRKLFEARKRAESAVNTTSKAGSRHLAVGGYHSSNNMKNSRGFLAINRVPNCPTIDQGYCDHVDGYPTEIDELMRSLISPEVFSGVFGTLEEAVPSGPSSITSRDDIPGSEETTLCSSVEHTIYPRLAQNKQGKFLYIVNNEAFTQGVRVEKCLNENSECSQLGNGAMPGYTSACRQKYIYKKMLSLSENGEPIHDTFKLPSCCVCYIRSSLLADRREPTSQKRPEPIVLKNKQESDDAEEVTESFLSDSVAETTVHDALITFVDYPLNVNSTSASSATEKSNDSHLNVAEKVKESSSRYFSRNFY